MRSSTCSPTCCRRAHRCCSPTPSASAPAARTWSAPARSSWRRAGSPPAWAATPRSTWAPAPTAASTRCSSTPVVDRTPGPITLSPLTSPGRDDAFAPAVHEVESYRGDTDRALTDLRAHVATGGVAVLVVAGPGTAQRAIEQLRDADVPGQARRRRLADRAASPVSSPSPAAASPRGSSPGSGHRRRPGRAHRGRRHRQPRRDGGPAHAGQQAAPQRRRSRHPVARRLRGARPARDRPLRRDAGADGQRRDPRVPRAGVRLVEEGPARRPAVRPDGRAGRGQPLRRRRGAHAEQARRRRLGQDQGPGPQGGPGDRRAARPALRRPPVRSRARVRPRHALAA